MNRYQDALKILFECHVDISVIIESANYDDYYRRMVDFSLHLPYKLSEKDKKTWFDLYVLTEEEYDFLQEIREELC